MENKQLYFNGEEIASPSMPVIEITGTTPTQQLEPNILYRFGSVNTLTITLASESSNKTSLFWFSFTAADNNTTVTLPSTIKLANEYTWDIVADRKFEVTIQDNIATVIYVD